MESYLKVKSMGKPELIDFDLNSDTADPRWDGELMDNAFVFTRHVHGGQLQLHRNKGDLQGFEPQRRTRSEKCHGYKDVSTESKQTLTSTVAQQTVPIGLE